MNCNRLINGSPTRTASRRRLKVQTTCPNAGGSSRPTTCCNMSLVTGLVCSDRLNSRCGSTCLHIEWWCQQIRRLSTSPILNIVQKELPFTSQTLDQWHLNNKSLLLAIIYVTERSACKGNILFSWDLICIVI